MIELVISKGEPDWESLTIKESLHPNGVARLTITEGGATASCSLKEETLDRVIVELGLLKLKFQTGGYVLD